MLYSDPEGEIVAGLDLPKFAELITLTEPYFISLRKEQGDEFHFPLLIPPARRMIDEITALKLEHPDIPDQVIKRLHELILAGTPYRATVNALMGALAVIDLAKTPEFAASGLNFRKYAKV